MAVERLRTPVEKNMSASSKTTFTMGKESGLTPTVTAMKVALRVTYSKDMAPTSTPMATKKRAIGKAASTSAQAENEQRPLFDYK